MSDASTFTHADLFNCWYGSEPGGPPAATVALWNFLEVGGVRDCNKVGDPDHVPRFGTMMEACDDADAEIWSVYGHYAPTDENVGVECITDAPSKARAMEIAEHLGTLWGLPVKDR